MGLSRLDRKSPPVAVNKIYLLTHFVLHARKSEGFNFSRDAGGCKALETQRDQLLSNACIYTGLRISELISIKQNQIFIASGGTRSMLEVTKANKKTTVYSHIPIYPKLRDQLVSYKKNFLDAMADASP